MLPAWHPGPGPVCQDVPLGAEQAVGARDLGGSPAALRVLAFLWGEGLALRGGVLRSAECSLAGGELRLCLSFGRLVSPNKILTMSVEFYFVP